MILKPNPLWNCMEKLSHDFLSISVLFYNNSLFCFQWVHPGWLPGALQAAPPSSTRHVERKRQWTAHGSRWRQGEITHQFLSQAKETWDKAISCQSNQSRIARNKKGSKSTFPTIFSPAFPQWWWPGENFLGTCLSETCKSQTKVVKIKIQLEQLNECSYPQNISVKAWRTGISA